MYTLHTDASVLRLGAVLNVSRDGKEKPVAFFTRQLKCAEKRHSATDLEALAVVEAVDHFLLYLYGRSFQVIMDHKASEQLMTIQGTESPAPRIHAEVTGTSANYKIQRRKEQFQCRRHVKASLKRCPET